MRRLVPIFASLCLILALPACGGGDDDGAASPDAAPVDDGRFRVVFISDTHITGPEYQCCSETPGIDNASIVKTADRLREVVERLNAITPRPDLVFILGDVTHNPYYSTERAYYDTHDNAFQDLKDILAGLQIPYHIALGNHDYGINCTDGAYVSREFTAGIFHDFLGVEPYSVVDHKGWRFVLANSMLGPTWDPGNPMCDTDLASYGSEQLAWIDEQLSAGMPTTVMSHFTYDVTKTDEDPGAANPDLLTVLKRHAADSVVLTLAGHLHRWLDFQDAYPFSHYVIGSTRYDVDNYWVVEMDPKHRSFRFLDAEKSRRLFPCSEEWLYMGDPTYESDQPAENGDCE
jgi:3',5'-cyclic AMP phosphodiesterase CpdA